VPELASHSAPLARTQDESALACAEDEDAASGVDGRQGGCEVPGRPHY
jgi:hypothetical protein